jgi:hypothetical protein
MQFAAVLHRFTHTTPRPKRLEALAAFVVDDSASLSPTGQRIQCADLKDLLRAEPSHKHGLSSMHSVRITSSPVRTDAQLVASVKSEESHAHSQL